MTQFNLKASLPKPVNAETATPKIDTTDNGIIRFGGGFRLPPVEITDNARVRFGGGFRLPTA